MESGYKVPTPSGDDRSTAPFNMALFTLEKIHNILKHIVNASIVVDERVTAGQIQHMKYRLVRQLFIQSITLIDRKKEGNKEWKKGMAIRIKVVQLYFGEKTRGEQIVGNFQAYNQDTEDELDDITIDIQERLQDEGYFMPPKDDPRHSWKHES